jgi:hypothetical protein
LIVSETGARKSVLRLARRGKAKEKGFGAPPASTFNACDVTGEPTGKPLKPRAAAPP